MNFNLIYNSTNGGYMKDIQKGESVIFDIYKEKIERWRVSGINLQELQEANKNADDVVNATYAGISSFLNN